MKQRTLSLTLKGAVVLGSALGICLLLATSDDVASTLSYFTTQSNLIVIGLFAWLFLRELSGHAPSGRVYVLLKGGATAWIVLTGLVFNLVLRPAILAGDSGYDPNTLKDFLVHGFTPLFALVDFLAFDVHGKIRRLDPLLWLSYPALYWGYTLVFVALGGSFNLGGEGADVPYFFMDVEAYGFLPVVFVALLVVAIGYGLFGLDRLGARLVRNGETQR